MAFSTDLCPIGPQTRARVCHPHAHEDPSRLRMRQIQLPPRAPAMLESLRAIGYSFDAALADIVDNSITAGATRIEVRYPPESAARLTIVDNGSGMAPDELVEAMRHGGVGPARNRSAEDLGRFGLGMKT